MRYSFVFLVVLFFAATHAQAQLDETRAQIKKEVEGSPWNCAKVTDFEMVSPDHIGNAFRVTCDVYNVQEKKSSIQYRVTKPLVGDLKIEPWR